MSLKELLVSVDASTSGLERMRFALDLARSHDAYLTAYYSSPTVSESSEGSPGEMAEAIEQQFETELTARHLKGGWMLSGDPIVEDLVDRIKYTDLAILGLGSPGSGEPDPQGFKISDVVLSCGRPLLATPVSRLPMKFSKVLVAWNGSCEATRALHDAIPLMKGAQNIWITSIGPDGPALAKRAAAHLQRHGLSAAVDLNPPFEWDIGSELMERAAMFEADLVVAGAYGHSKLAENLFGGASNALLEQMLVPILVSH